MAGLQYSIDINAPVHTVWSTMLDDETYRDWTSAFGEGSYYEGDWSEGSTIRFIGPEDDGSLSGIIGTVVASRPDEFVSVEYFGQIVDGEVDTTSDDAQVFVGSYENYSFQESDGVTTVTVELSDDEMMNQMKDLWPPALARVKELAENR
jgi:uncharacterized protein YndB with AHSA1/START domain